MTDLSHDSEKLCRSGLNQVSDQANHKNVQKNKKSWAKFCQVLSRNFIPKNENLTNKILNEKIFVQSETSFKLFDYSFANCKIVGSYRVFYHQRQVFSYLVEIAFQVLANFSVKLYNFYLFFRALLSQSSRAAVSWRRSCLSGIFNTAETQCFIYCFNFSYLFRGVGSNSTSVTNITK